MISRFSIPLTLTILAFATILTLQTYDQKIDLNIATKAQLQTLPGIGPMTAQKILNAREKRNGFRSLSDLLKIDGIGRKTVARLQPLVKIGKYQASKIDNR